MAIAIEIGQSSFLEALKTVSRRDKILIIKWLERDLLSDWDEYEKLPEVNEKIDIAMREYRSGDVIDLDDISL